MVAYNVTVNIDNDVHEHWLEWMKNEHLPMVMNTGKFLKYTMFRLLDRQEDETGTTYSIQYLARTMDDYQDYQREHAPTLQAETRKYFEGKFVAFRTIMQLEHSYEKV
jgi:hypothetical protein